MKLWTLCTDRKRWRNRWTLTQSDTMGNVFDRIKENENSALTLKEYPDDFLDKFSDELDKYAIQVDEFEQYDNDDYDIYETNERTYTTSIDLGRMTVISGDRPVGYMIKSTEYAGGMCNRSETCGTILFFDKPNKEAGETFDEHITVRDQSGRWSTRRTYTIIERKSDE